MSVIEKEAWQQDAYGNDHQSLYLFHCPGCQYGHWFKTDGVGPCWTFNGDMNKPTVRASILVQGQYRCHSFITDGNIQFLGDCDHALAGQTVALPDWNELLYANS